MKNIYELSEKEKSKYRDEFNKLAYTRNYNIGIGISIAVFVVASVAFPILSDFSEASSSFKDLVDIADFLGTAAIGLFFVLEVWLNHAFKRWMKIKHNIEY